MYCPKCRSEYREGFTECATCDVPLVEELPPEEEPEFINFVTIFETGNPAIIAFAKSILESEGIVHYIKGEGIQNLFAKALVSPVAIQVDKNDAEYAKQLLEQIEEGDFEASDNGTDESDHEDSLKESDSISSNTGSAYFIKGLLIGILITGAAFFLYNWKQKQFTGINEYDFNGDSKPDVFYYYEKNVIGVCQDSCRIFPIRV